MDYKKIIQNIQVILPDFQSWVKKITYEEKGVLYSDILFMLACLEGVKINRVLESGRAKGQSTLLLATAFPHTEIISIEYDKNSPDVEVAKKRLRDVNNVKLLFGDSQVIMPQLVEKSDVVIIDGPKMFLAIRLALRLLASGKPNYVFIHDMTVGSPWRNFLNRFFPEALFSDYIELAKVTSIVDERIFSSLPPEKRVGGFEGEYGYGFALTYLPYRKERNYKALYLLSFLADWITSPILPRLYRKLINLSKKQS